MLIYSKKQDTVGFTLIELIVALVIMGAFFTMLTQFFLSGEKDAEIGAREWGQGMGYTLTGIQCQSQDSDGNGKISCDVRTSSGEVFSLDCSVWSDKCTTRKMTEVGEW